MLTLSPHVQTREHAGEHRSVEKRSKSSVSIVRRRSSRCSRASALPSPRLAPVGSRRLLICPKRCARHVTPLQLIRRNADLNRCVFGCRARVAEDVLSLISHQRGQAPLSLAMPAKNASNALTALRRVGFCGIPRPATPSKRRRAVDSRVA